MIDVALTQPYDVPHLDESQLRARVVAVCGEHAMNDGTVSLAVLDDAEMTALNRRYKQRDRTTDCFSFDLSDPTDPPASRSFEILVNGQKAVREAQARGHTVQAELSLYVVHGLLHNLGFDDQSPAAAVEMHAREDEILQRFGYGVVYNRADTKA